MLPPVWKSAALAVVVLGHVDAAARLEVRIEVELLTVQVADGGVAQFVEVVGKNLRGKTHGDAFHALRQQEGELDGQGDGFAVSSVVGLLPLGGLGIKDDVQGELRQARFNVSGGRRIVSRQDVAPVSLAVDEEVFLPQLHQGILDGGVPVRMKLHRLAHDVGHLVVSSVLHPPHRVEDAPLHGLQAVHHVGHGALQYDVGGVVQEPRLIHPAQPVPDVSVLGIGGFVVGMFGAPFGQGILGQIVFRCFVVFAHNLSGGSIASRRSGKGGRQMYGKKGKWEKVGRIICQSGCERAKGILYSPTKITSK